MRDPMPASKEMARRSSVVCLLCFVVVTASCDGDPPKIPAGSDGGVSVNDTSFDSVIADSADAGAAEDGNDAGTDGADSTSDNTDGGDGGDGAADAVLSAPGPVWLPLGVTAIDASGHSLPLSVTVASNDRFLAIRVRPAQPDPSAPWCFAIEDVVLPDGSVWIQPLSSKLGAGSQSNGSQRALPQHGYGVFVLPNDGVSALPDGVIHFRVVLRDCRYDIPVTRVDGGANQGGLYAKLAKSVVVEFAHEAAFAANAQPRLEIRIAISALSGINVDTLATNDGWTKAIAAAQAIFASAGVTLTIGRVAAFEAPSILTYGPGMRTELDAAYDSALTALTDNTAERSLRFVPVMIVRCLLRDTPIGGLQTYAGQTTRLPGGAPFGASASGVFISTLDCTQPSLALSGSKLGFILAHELGHHLGLLHTNTPLGEQRSESGVTDVMQSTSSAIAFTAKQAAAMRRHFDVTVQ